MMYDISVKNFNNVEIFRGQNFTEELIKLALKKYSTYPVVSVWKSPDPETEKSEPEKKEERYQAYEDLAFNTNRDELAKSCAEFVKDYCENIKECKKCIFGKYDNSGWSCGIDNVPEWRELKEGAESEEEE